MKRFKGFNPVLFAAAVIFLCVTVYSLVSNVTVYVRQRDWPVTTATVIDVASLQNTLICWETDPHQLTCLIH